VRREQEESKDKAARQSRRRPEGTPMTIPRLVRNERHRVFALVIATTIAVLLLPVVAWAEAGHPGWELSANTYPTNLIPGKDEVQEVVPSATASSFTLRFREAETRPIDPAGLTGRQLQEDLEALPSIGAGNVEVQGPNGGGGYTVTFVALLGNTHTPELEGTEAAVSVLVDGASSGTIGIDVFNVGAGASSGTITVTDTLPKGLRAKEAGELHTPLELETQSIGIRPSIEEGVWDCTGDAEGPPPKVAGATVVTCTNDPSGLPVFDGGGGMPVPTHGAFRLNVPNPQPPVGISVEATEPLSEAKNRVSIVGGGALEAAATEDAVVADHGRAPGGLVSAATWNSNEDGTADIQAGSHPYESTFVLTFATAIDEEGHSYIPGGEPRNIETLLPAGFVGNLRGVPQCTKAQLFATHCPPESMVGLLQAETLAVPIIKQLFNMVPETGAPAEFGFEYEGLPAYLRFEVRSGSDYGIVAHVDNLPAGRELYQSMVTVWGNPSAPSHDRWRAHEGGCSEEQEREVPMNGEINYCLVKGGAPAHVITTLPTACGAPQQTLFRETAAWQGSLVEPLIASVQSHDESGAPAGLAGCEALAFEPTIAIRPDTASADTPTGLAAEVTPTFAGLEAPGGRSSADIKNTTVVLPPGLVVNPGQAAGLLACPPGRPSLEAGRETYGDGLTTPEEKARGEEDNGPAHCPNASKVGTFVVKTPLLEADAEKQFEGNVYVLRSNPPELKLLLAGSADGVNLKLPGTASLCEAAGEVLDGKTCEAPGQLITAFDETPQLPFTLFKLAFSGGAQAALDTPAQCGTYTASTDFAPWSTPFTPDVLRGSAFQLAEGPGGGACPASPLPFSPSLTAGSTTDQAGGFTDFSMLLQRGDGQQRIEKLQFEAPAGLSGMISQVPLCGEAEANAGTCSASSRIGHATVTSGPGPYPLVIPQPGEPEAPIYLTGPYGGAPFGLSIVTPVIAGPFDLGTIVTRARIDIDPHTAQITVTTNPLPQIVDGVPTDLREVDAVIDRPGFMFNPTNCDSMAFSGTAWGTPPPSEGGPHAQAAISSHFGVGSCRELGFEPKFSVSTAAHATRSGGASLDVKVQYPSGPAGAGRATGQANIAGVKVELPKQLPSRLSTLQKACTAAQFNANPAGCPAASVVGRATVHTAVLPVALEGPAYFVSNGGEAFPNLIVVLQGDGVTIDLVGDTFISKAGITSSTFKATPDVPFSSFELKLPQGEHSALAAIGNLCRRTLLMPTTLTAQNGATLHQSTRVAVQGCPNALGVKFKRVRGRRVTLGVLVPAAGHLSASGNGLAKASKASRGREEVRLTLHVRRHGRFTSKVRLSFTPSAGKERGKLGRSVSVAI
jgi:hypothetical protein